MFLSKTVLTSRNLMNPRFRDLLSPEDEALRLLVKEFRHKLKASAEARRSPAMVRTDLPTAHLLHWVVQGVTFALCIRTGSSVVC